MPKLISAKSVLTKSGESDEICSKSMKKPFNEYEKFCTGKTPRFSDSCLQVYITYTCKQECTDFFGFQVVVREISAQISANENLGRNLRILEF